MANKFGLELLGRTTGTAVAFQASSNMLNRLHDANKPLPAWWPPEKVQQATVLVDQGFAVVGAGWFYGLTLKGFEALSAENPGLVHEGLSRRMANWNEITSIVEAVSNDLTLSYEEYGNKGFKMVISGDNKSLLGEALARLAEAGFNIGGWKIGTPIFYKRYPIDLYR
ncbi:hypothetical protein HYS03_00960 [Candidatus Woesebacteria bacterium]|nr:hypothetical protein [Candidatus Woesebacteria bacterium]QQG47225.1 MAG: hypothetical protein HY044_03775 [Candidatus Woesebacteria bacterium]